MQLLHNFKNHCLFDGKQEDLFDTKLELKFWEGEKLQRFQLDPLGHYKNLAWPLIPMSPEVFQRILSIHEIKNRKIGKIDFFKNQQDCNVYQATANHCLWLWAMGEYQPTRWSVYALGCWRYAH